MMLFAIGMIQSSPPGRNCNDRFCCPFTCAPFSFFLICNADKIAPNNALCSTSLSYIHDTRVPLKHTKMYSTLFSGRIAQIVFVAQYFKSGRIDQSGSIYPAMNSSAALCSPFNKYPVRRSSVQRELCFTENFVQPDTPPPACLLHSHHPPPPVILQDIQKAHLSKNRRYDPKNNYCYLSQTTSIGDLSVCLCLSVGCALFPPPR